MQKINDIRGFVKEGNSCLFLLFVIFNFLTFLSSLGLLGISIYLFVLTKQANGFNIGFLAVAVVLLLMSVLAFTMRRSIHLLFFYLMIIFVVFLAELTITILIVTNEA